MCFIDSYVYQYYYKIINCKKMVVRLWLLKVNFKSTLSYTMLVCWFHLLRKMSIFWTPDKQRLADENVTLHQQLHGLLGSFRFTQWPLSEFMSLNRLPFKYKVMTSKKPSETPMPLTLGYYHDCSTIFYVSFYPQIIFTQITRIRINYSIMVLSTRINVKLYTCRMYLMVSF